jgi:sulfur carrier protein ThiS
MTDNFRLVACRSLNHENRQDTYFEAGRTLRECLTTLGWRPEGLHARVSINGEIVPDAEWLDAKPTAGQSVVVRTVPTGGDGKQAGQIVGMIMLAIAAAYVAGGAGGHLGTLIGAGEWQAGAAGAGLAIGGSLALNALIPQPLPRRLRDLQEAA